MRNTIIICLSLLATPFILSAEDKSADKERPTNAQELNEISSTCNRFVEIMGYKEEQKKWDKKLTERIKQRIADSSICDEDSALRSIALDWLAGNDNKVRNKDIEGIKVTCFFLIRFIDINHTMPTQLRDRLTNMNYRKLLDHLEEEMKKTLALKDK